MLGSFVLGVVLEEVLSNVLDGIFRFIFLLCECGECLKDKGYYCVIEIGSNG
jgi:hypothetical protein